MAAGGESQGLPQLDITTWPSQVFWLVVVFAIGYVFISRMVTPKIGSFLKNVATVWMMTLGGLVKPALKPLRFVLITKLL